MNLLKKTLLYGVITLLVLIIISLFMLTTQIGLNVAISVAKSAAPGELKIEEARGNLLNSLLLNKIRYHEKDLDVSIGRLEFQWHPTYLLAGRLSVPVLTIKNVAVMTPPAPEVQQNKTQHAPNSIPNISLPINISLGNLNVTHVRYNDTVVDSIRASLKTDNNKVNIVGISIQKDDVTYNVKGNIALTPTLPMKIDAEIAGKVLYNQPLQTRINIDGDLGKLNLDIASRAPFEAKLKARITDVINLKNIRVDGEWSNILAKLEKYKHVKSKQGKLAFAGNLDKYNITLDTILGGTAIPDSEITLEAHGNTAQVTLPKLLIKTLSGAFEGTASAHFEPSLEWEATLDATHINPGEMWHDTQGDINFAMVTAGRKDTTLNTHTTIDDLHGKLRNFDIKGRATINTVDNHVTLKNTQFNIGDTNIQIDGDVKDTWNASWNIDIPNMYTLTPYGTGALHTKGTITGKLKTPLINFSATADKLDVQGASLAKLKMNAKVNFAPGGQSNMTLNASGLDYQEHLIDNVNLAFNGTTENHNMKLHIASPNANFSTQITGHFDQENWKANITALTLALKDSDTWQLASPSQLSVSDKHVTVEPIKLTSLDQTFILQGGWQEAGAMTAALDLINLNLHSLDTFLPNDLKITGKGDIHFNASQKKQNAPIQASLKTIVSPGTITYPHNDQNISLPFQGVSITADLGANGLNADLSVRQDNTTPIDINVTLPEFHPEKGIDLSQSINGKINFAFGNLDLIPSLTPFTDKTEGTLISDITISGTLEDPRVKGEISLKNGLVSVPTYGITVKNISFSLEGNRTNNITITSRMESGEGFIETKANITLSTKDLKAKASITGKDFQVMNTKEFQVIVAPALTVDYQNYNVKLDGKVDVIKADIIPKDFSSTVSMPDNVIYEGAAQEKEKINLSGSVKLNVVNPIHFKMMGLDANIKGNMALTFEPEQLPIAHGEFNVTSGSFMAYGQKLTIKRAIITYHDVPVNNPGLSIQATRQVKSIQAQSGPSPNSQIKTITVGVNAIGTARNLRITLFSDPAGLSQGDILSYIMLGRPQNRVAGSEATLLLQALSSSDSGSNVEHIQKELQDTLGLDEFSIEDSPQVNPDNNQAEDNTSLVIGKKLTEKLSAQYSVGLLIPVNVFRLVYKITSRLSAQIETSAIEDGADLFYTIERK